MATLSRLNALDASREAERYRVIAYLLHLILHRRPADEHSDLITVVKTHTQETEVETMAQSMAEVLIEQGVERGARETTIENTLTVLTTRFPNADIRDLRPTLEAVRDLNRLKQLILKASLAPSFREFRRELEA